MIAEPLYCPYCTSGQTVKNGCIHNGKQNHKCKDCGRQLVEGPQKKIIRRETKELIDKLLLENLPMTGRVEDYPEISEVQKVSGRPYTLLRVATASVNHLDLQVDQLSNHGEVETEIVLPSFLPLRDVDREQGPKTSRQIQSSAETRSKSLRSVVHGLRQGNQVSAAQSSKQMV